MAPPKAIAVTATAITAAVPARRSRQRRMHDRQTAWYVTKEPCRWRSPWTFAIAHSAFHHRRTHAGESVVPDGLNDATFRSAAAAEAAVADVGKRVAGDLPRREVDERVFQAGEVPPEGPERPLLGQSLGLRRLPSRLRDVHGPCFTRPGRASQQGGAVAKDARSCGVRQLCWW